MTKALPFTEAIIRRAIAAARKAGIAVNALTIRPDGSVTLHQADPAPGSAPPSQTEIDRWTDIEV
jgi:hypothetical protein